MLWVSLSCCLSVVSLSFTNLVLASLARGHISAKTMLVKDRLVCCRLWMSLSCRLSVVGLECNMFRHMPNVFRYNNVCYGFLKQSTYSWMTARTRCEAANASSVYIDSREEYNALKKWVYDDMRLVSMNSRIWTAGYRRSGSRVGWYWSRLAGGMCFMVCLSCN